MCPPTYRLATNCLDPYVCSDLASWKDSNLQLVQLHYTPTTAHNILHTTQWKQSQTVPIDWRVEYLLWPAMTSATLWNLSHRRCWYTCTDIAHPVLWQEYYTTCLWIIMWMLVLHIEHRSPDAVQCSALKLSTQVVLCVLHRTSCLALCVGHPALFCTASSTQICVEQRVASGCD